MADKEPTKEITKNEQKNERHTLIYYSKSRDEGYVKIRQATPRCTQSYVKLRQKW